MFNKFLFVVPLIIPSPSIYFSEGFKSFLLLGLFFFSLFSVIESIIIFIRRFKK